MPCIRILLYMCPMHLFCINYIKKKEGRGGQQMMPELLNKAFQQKSHITNLENAIKNPKTHYF